MIDVSKQMLKFHDEEVTLPKGRQTEMKNRRDTNRNALKVGLKKQENPSPDLFASQGSYMMRTMVQSPENEIDIDDGVYFGIEDLKGSQGANKSALDARKMVCEALTDGRSFNTPPEVKTNCVRVYYNEGYHIDIPVYRTIADPLSPSGERVELASADWKASDARGVTEWFNGAVKKSSPQSDADQMRRIVRLLKKFSISRTSWAKKTTSGFVISRLTEECYIPSDGRDDESLRKTMRSILDRLAKDTTVTHPLLDENITKSSPDTKTTFFHDCILQHEADLDTLESASCTFSEAMQSWSAIFNTDFFNEQPDPNKSNKRGSIFDVTSAPAVVVKGGNPDYA